MDWLRGLMTKLTLACPGQRAKGPPGRPNGPRGADSGCSDVWAGRCWVRTSPPMAPWMMTAATRPAMSAPMTRPYTACQAGSVKM